jgi:hypothetical protein
MRRVLVSMLMIGMVMGLCGLASAGETAAKPVATIAFDAGSVAAGIGYSWGSGTLTYKGKKYPFKVDGLAVGDVGVTKVDAVGEVYDLKNLDDFAGTYTATSAEATVGGGAGIARMKNQNGVTLIVKARTQGINFKLALSGVKFELKK